MYKLNLFVCIAAHGQQRSGTCASGETVSYESRLISKKRLAVFDDDGRFGGLNNYASYASTGAGSGSLYYAVTSLTCETQP